MKASLVRKLVIGLMLITVGCGGSYRGQLLGVLNRPNFVPTQPYGMITVPTGTLHIGPSDQDVNHSLAQRSKSTSIQAFYMDDTELTNNEYRQFVSWVRDSIAHYLLEHFQEDDENDEPNLDWSIRIDWEDPETRELLDELYISESNRFYGKREVDKDKMVYVYQWIDYKEASKIANRGKDRVEFIKTERVPIYPDTLVWVRDFTYSYNEPMTANYFYHPAFDDYPVVGLTWDKANAFSEWRTKFWSDYRTSRGQPLMDKFRLPTESEWEYAARGGKKLSPFPWGGPYVRNSKGCILANFKPGRGNYPEDGGFYTVRADAYWPNDYGLYCMAGNVSEWTSTAFYENSYSFIHDLNPQIRYDHEENESETMKRKVIRGGSWKDIAYYIQTGTRHYEYSDTAKSYIGFRNVTTLLGRDR